MIILHETNFVFVIDKNENLIDKKKSLMNKKESLTDKKRSLIDKSSSHRSTKIDIFGRNGAPYLSASSYGRPNGAKFKKINLHHNSTVTFNVKNYV